AGSLGQTLGQERERVQQQGGLGGGLLGSLLDQDGDGQVGMGDLLKMGGSLLGGRR
ncbi:MAG: calcium-binding protein, partial [Polaromonas sp.]|nr:calcium-binding protein [Polaromonas sp.]